MEGKSRENRKGKRRIREGTGGKRREVNGRTEKVYIGKGRRGGKGRGRTGKERK